MSKLMSAFTLAAVSSFAFAAPALAGDAYEAEMKPAKVETLSVMTITTDARQEDMLIEASAEVRGAVERGEFTAVEGPDGRIYYNRNVPISELPDPELDLRVLDTVEVEYDNTVYTNKIVQPVN